MDFKQIFTQNVNKFFRQTKKMPVAHKFIILGFMFFVGLVASITLIAILVGMYFGFAKVNDLHVLLNDVTSPSAVAAILMAGRWFVDQDGDGVSDQLQNKERSGRDERH